MYTVADAAQNKACVAVGAEILLLIQGHNFHFSYCVPYFRLQSKALSLEFVWA
jgi:hypothetical protein